MATILKDATATITAGASVSNIVFVGAGYPVAIQMPASWTAADLTFQSSYDINGPFVDLYVGTNEYKESAAASRHVQLDPATFQGCRFLKVRSGTSSVAVNQAADRALVVLMRKERAS